MKGLLMVTLWGCTQENDQKSTEETTEDTAVEETLDESAYQITKSILYDGVEVDLIIDKPEGTKFDVLVVYHGTVWSDSQIHSAALNTLNGFSGILDRSDMMIVSVVYPEENLLMGDNLIQAEAGLLWVQNQAETELGIELDRVFVGGHSQGGYIATILNTIHQTDGVIANSPGPLNFAYRCQLEDSGGIESSNQCRLMAEVYGSATENPDPYIERSLLWFTSGYQSPILFVQGMEDADIQLYSWPTFVEGLNACDDCQEIQIFEAEGVGHPALFESREAMSVFNEFVR